MTNLEALLAEVDPFSPNRNTAIRALDKVGLTYTDATTDEDETDIATAAVDILSKMLVLTSESEGGLSQGYSADAIRARIRQLCDQYDLDASSYISQPSVRDGSTRW